MAQDDILRAIETGRIIAILRGDFGGREEEIVALLIETGITAVEVTLNSAGAFSSIELLATQFASNAAVGAGTVLTANDVKRAADAGARFIVSPNRDLTVIEATKQRQLASFPGCFTPSEIVEALQAGADAAKVFPAQCLGTNFIKAIQGPLPDVRLIPTGGVTPEAAANYLKAGAWAVGVGSELLGAKVRATGASEDLRQRCLSYVAAVRESVAHA
ncbi:MAG: bifunctional 4-hydroxy-2-oxoglutarate aldolase/2-dehydro-3-deoxy-phosphogluconate aldolase [Verrucomicrobia bacterium]|nr:bifunctional 4-hydroxy-2-oxoglutarate aldolase/2-dehydro-3-deoxy-phosphogluconate aldolase [Verrucomicrobiota bacterium]